MWLLSSIACSGGSETVRGPSKCDGLLQEDDGGWIDAAYDRDGDGFFDPANADCVEAYGANRLDCDDRDAGVSPRSIEEQCNGVDDDCNPDTPDLVDLDEDGSPACEDCDDLDELRTPIGPDECWDQIDNNCTNVVDEGCGPNYNGRYALGEELRYTCGLPAAPIAKIAFDEVSVLWFPPGATMQTLGVGDPGPMDGSIEPDGSFTFVRENSISGGACVMVFTMEGQFESNTSFTGTFDATFSRLCLCRNQHWDVHALRVGDF